MYVITARKLHFVYVQDMLLTLLFKLMFGLTFSLLQFGGRQTTDCLY
jgi:hypothetical protein